MIEVQKWLWILRTCSSLLVESETFSVKTSSTRAFGFTVVETFLSWHSPAEADRASLPAAEAQKLLFFHFLGLIFTKIDLQILGQIKKKIIKNI